MNDTNAPIQLGGLSQGTRFMLAEDAQSNVFQQGPRYVVIDKVIENGVNLVVVAPDHKPGPIDPSSYRKLTYDRRVRRVQ